MAPNKLLCRIKHGRPITKLGISFLITDNKGRSYFAATQTEISL